MNLKFFLVTNIWFALPDWTFHILMASMLPDTIKSPVWLNFKQRILPSCLSKNLSNNTSSSFTWKMFRYPCSVPTAIRVLDLFTSKQKAASPVTTKRFSIPNFCRLYSIKRPWSPTLNKRLLSHVSPSILKLSFVGGNVRSTNHVLLKFHISILASDLQ